MLEIRNLSLKVGSFALKDIDLNIWAHQCHIIIGSTGCGKTTLLETLAGFKTALKGNIYLDGKEITALPVERRGFSYLPQDLALFPHLSVRDNIFYSLKVKRLKDKESYELISELIENTGIKHLLDRSIHNLSGGERQRVALIRAIATGNKYLLLDEPLSALHEGMRKELWYLIKELQKRYKLTIIMVTHDMEEAFFLGDMISVMIEGKIHQTGTKEDVYRFPGTIDAARFFGIRNIFEAEVVDFGNDILIARCNELKADLRLPRNLFIRLPNHSFTIGIRAGDVMISREDLKRPGQDNLLKGKVVEIYPKGAFHLILFVPNGTKRGIEIDMPDYAFNKLRLSTGQDISVILSGSSMFVLNNAY